MWVRGFCWGDANFARRNAVGRQPCSLERIDYIRMGDRIDKDIAPRTSSMGKYSGIVTMLENDIFEQWLAAEAERVLTKLKNSEIITHDDKLIIVLKGQTNHFQHLDVELRQEMVALRQDMDRRFEQVQERFERMDKRFEEFDKRFERVDKRFEQVDKRFEQVDRRFEAMTDEIKRLYRAINAQTWKIISAVGLIVLLGKLIENF